MATYQQELAEELKERYLLAGSTIRNWKYRQHIPDRYITGYVTRRRAPQQTTNAIKQWLDLPFIKRKGFQNIRPSVLNDLLRPDDGRKNARLRVEEAEQIIQQLHLLVQQFQKTVQDPNPERIKALFDTPYFQIKAFVNDTKRYCQLIDRRNKIQAQDEQFIQQRLADLLTKLPPLPSL